MELRGYIHSPAVTCTPDNSLAEAAHEMTVHNVGSVIIIDQEGTIAGVLTDRDIAVRGMGKRLEPDTPVAEIMTKDVVTLREDASVFDAAKAMATSTCRRLPVIGMDGGLKGVVSLDDLMQLFAHQTDALAQVVAVESATIESRL